MTTKERRQRKLRKHANQREQRPETDLQVRRAQFTPNSINEDERSVEVIIATETPVPMYDWQRDDFIPETLLISGARFGDGHVTALYNHNRWDEDAVVGSVRNIKAQENLTGRAHLSSLADKLWTRIKEGHIRDVSAGYRILKRTYVAPEQKMVIGNREFTGPLNVVTDWELREVSFTPVGADPSAKVRREKGTTMPEAGTLPDTKTPETKPAVKEPERKEPEVEQRKESETLNFDQMKADAKRALQEAQKEFQQEQDTVRGYAATELEKFGIKDQLSEVVRGCTTEAEVDKNILKALQANQNSNRTATISFGREGAESARTDIRNSLNTRCLKATGSSRKIVDLLPEGERSKGTHFDRMKLVDLGRNWLDYNGIDSRNMEDTHVAFAMLGFYDQAGIGDKVRTTPGFHTTGNFPYLMMDAMNKTLSAGYTERAWSWGTLFRTASPVADFKDIHKIRMSEVPNLPILPDNSIPEEVALKDVREKYAVEAYSQRVSYSFRAIINDDLDGFSRIPFLLGTAAGRSENALAWSKVTGNQTMEDGQPLFSAATGNRLKTNLGSSDTLNIANLAAARAIFRLQVGENTPGGAASPAILNLEPRYLVVPAALETTAQQLVLTAFDPGDNKPAGVYNPFNATLQVIVEPLLDASSTAKWYLFAPTSMIDTGEMTYLRGYENPRITTYEDPANMARWVQILHAYNFHFNNWRGAFRST